MKDRESDRRSDAGKGDPERLFARELEVFRAEVESGTQFFYAYLTINTVLRKNKKALNAVNYQSDFWRTIIGALQTSYFIVLGRILGQQGKKKEQHNIGRLLSIAHDNICIFSKEALAKRKRAGDPNINEWIDNYLKSVYVPTADDFQRLKKEVRECRKIYEEGYRDIRNKIFAHKEISENIDVQKLFSKTRIDELRRIFMFLNDLHKTLWELLNNGKQPPLRIMHDSLRSTEEERKSYWQSQSVKDVIVGETEDFFTVLVGAPQRGSEEKQRKKQKKMWEEMLVGRELSGQKNSMAKAKKNAERENRIEEEIIVDAYGPEEQAMGWYYYLEEKLHFPFTAACIAERAISPLHKGDEAEILGMAAEEECQHEMLVIMRWERRGLAIPLSQLKPIAEADKDTREAIEDWHYWIDQGYTL